MRRFRSVLILITVFGLAACADNTPEPAAFAVNSTEFAVKSRGELIPVTVTVPVTDEAVPLVVMAHGHGGSREEGGGYTRLAQTLSESGIATIRMDFPGCGDSTESFTANNLSNMLADIGASEDYALRTLNVDPERVGLMGYSMGGRLMSLYSAKNPDREVMAVWAPAVNPEPMFHMFGGQSEYELLRDTAQRTGEARYTTVWGSELVLGAQWFADMEASKPLDALSRYQGSLLVVYGDEDEAVYPATVEQGIAAASSARDIVAVKIPTAKHGLGFYTQRPEIADQVIETTVTFFAKTL